MRGDTTEQDNIYMREALALAEEAARQGEVPVGAIVVRDGAVIARAGNAVESQCNGCSHAEILALFQAQKAVGDWRLTDCTLYVTKEPCAMCAGAMVNCRLGRVVFGVADSRMGACGSALDIARFPGMLHTVEVTPNVLADECRTILQRFFQERRKKS